MIRVLAALVFTSAALAGPIRLPDQPAPPPLPLPAPADVPVKLTPERLYVIDSDVPLVVLSSPAGVLRAIEEAGPIKIRGMFVDGGDKVQTRTFAGKHVYTVEVADGKSGACELIVIPVGLKSESEIIRRRVDAGTAPQPPPVPPKPDPAPTPAKLIVLIVEETAAAAATRGALFTDSALAGRMSDKGHRWRIVDKDVVGVDGKPPADVARFLDAAKGSALPQVFLVDPQGQTRIQTALPAKAADLVELLKKAGG